MGISPLECFFQIPPNIRSSPWCLFIAQRSKDSLPSSESRSCGGIGRRQIGHLFQQRLLVPRVLCLSEPPDVGDVLLLDVPHVGDVLGVIQLQGAEQPPLQSLRSSGHADTLKGWLSIHAWLVSWVRLSASAWPYPPGTDLAAWP